MIGKRLINLTNKCYLPKNNGLLVSKCFKYFSDLSDNEFINQWNDMSDWIIEEIEKDELTDVIDDYADNEELINIEFVNGSVMVINRHMHNKEIW